MELFKYILFVIIYLYICNWLQIRMFFKSVFRPKETIEYLKDKSILSLIKRKTGLELKQIEIFNSKRLYGAMVGIPNMPRMVLSKGLYTTFNKDELEWVLLHEAAHCIKWHNLKCAVIQITFLLVGIFIMNIFQALSSIFLIPILALLISIISIQFMKYTEYEADEYSINKVDNPKGVITAQDKFAKANPSSFYNEKNVTRRLFYWNILPSERIKMAKARLSINI